MPYKIIGEEVIKPGKFRGKVKYTIANSHDGITVGMVTIYHPGRGAEKIRFTATDGKTRIPRRTHSRQINGMRRAVQDHRARPAVTPVTADTDLSNLWGDPWRATNNV